jgi:hypothetical protein
MPGFVSYADAGRAGLRFGWAGETDAEQRWRDLPPEGQVRALISALVECVGVGVGHARIAREMLLEMVGELSEIKRSLAAPVAYPPRDVVSDARLCYLHGGPAPGTPIEALDASGLSERAARSLRRGLVEGDVRVLGDLTPSRLLSIRGVGRVIADEIVSWRDGPPPLRATPEDGP